ncbi:uncharacterized protein Dyak_GE27725 [Drosophila yakuba]|uniref:Uncharacterized protein n=1 Tax=Drosophila yakuba TaxID=7245 RepID=A0A0R1DP42_DROYA|nr:uncharacterized protein Dyak_GE27725 [Drosophila yakuba]
MGRNFCRSDGCFTRLTAFSCPASSRSAATSPSARAKSQAQCHPLPPKKSFLYQDKSTRLLKQSSVAFNNCSGKHPECI